MSCGSKSKLIKAVAVFESSKVLKGHVILRQDSVDPNLTVIEANVSGFKPNKLYAWHIHEAGDLRGGDCHGACAHYNPHGKNHGGLKDAESHVGDLGNLKTDAQGRSRTKIKTRKVKLKGKYSVIGRSIVIHKFPDDLGRGGTKESLTTGSAGARLACGVIGYAKDGKIY